MLLLCVCVCLIIDLISRGGWVGEEDLLLFCFSKFMLKLLTHFGIFPHKLWSQKTLNSNIRTYGADYGLQQLLNLIYSQGCCNMNPFTVNSFIFVDLEFHGTVYRKIHVFRALECVGFEMLHITIWVILVVTHYLQLHITIWVILVVTHYLWLHITCSYTLLSGLYLWLHITCSYTLLSG